MEVPCPVPLERPWSPAGYQVVEIASEGKPTVSSAGELPARPPSSPVGYRVTVTETSGPGKAARPTAPAVRVVGRRGQQPVLFWGLVTGGALLVFGCMCALITAQLSQPDGPQASTVRIDVGDRVMPRAALPPVNLEPAIPDLDRAPAVMAPPKRLGKDECAVCNAAAPVAPAHRETFGTAVSFARNPTEAFQAATGERKLAFVLHVSGNFEEARFT